MADDMTIDRNRIYAIGLAARLLGVSPSTLRDLERRGQLEATRTPRGQRRFLGAELIRVREQSIGVFRKPPTVSTASVDAEAQARHGWLGSWVARAQRELPSDAPAEARVRLGADLERALRPLGPKSADADVERLVKSLIDRARCQTDESREAAERRAMKGQLLDHALAHLRRRIHALSTRLVGATGSLERQHIRSMLRNQLRDLLQKRFAGDEDWDQARELADEVLADWYVKQSPASRIPTTVKVLAAGATGVVGGAAGRGCTRSTDPGSSGRAQRAAPVARNQGPEPLQPPNPVNDALSRFAESGRPSRVGTADQPNQGLALVLPASLTVPSPRHPQTDGGGPGERCGDRKSG